MRTRHKRKLAALPRSVIPARRWQISEAREFIRLPPVGERCPHTGLSRAALNAWILPTEKNAYNPPVKSFVVRQPGCKTGIRLISWQSLREWIFAHEDHGDKAA